MSRILEKIKLRFEGISWRNKYIHLLLRCLDVPDCVVRTIRGYGYLPRYSIRIRSTGFLGQFGGRQFANRGNTIARLLTDHAALKPDERVVEVGCGCGATALPLARVMEDGRYAGLDIDKTSIEACHRNALLKRKRFDFEWMDVYNAIYNPNSRVKADTYTFPYPDGCADVIFLASVFTHMLHDDVSNYIREISRMLRPGGRCFFTTFLMDFGHEGFIDFPFDHGVYRLHKETLPEKAIGYYGRFFEERFKAVGMTVQGKPLLGLWNFSKPDAPKTLLNQDVMIFKKK